MVAKKPELSRGKSKWRRNVQRYIISDGMRNLPPLAGFSDSSIEATTRAMAKYGIVQRDEHNDMWHFRKKWLWIDSNYSYSYVERWGN